MPQEIRKINGMTDRDRHQFLAYDDACREEAQAKGHETGIWYGQLAPLKRGQTVRGVSIE